MIKNELEITDYQESSEAFKEIAKYFRYYNFDRRHSSIDCCSPAQFEKIINRQN